MRVSSASLPPAELCAPALHLAHLRNACGSFARHRLVPAELGMRALHLPHLRNACGSFAKRLQVRARCCKQTTGFIVVRTCAAT